MAVETKIRDAALGTDKGAGVTSRGQLVVAPLSFNEPYYQSLSVPATAYNFIAPISGKRFVIDGVIFSSDKGVSSTNGAVIKIFEADAFNSSVSTKDIFTLDIGRLDKGSIPSLNVITSEGIWINATTDDATTNVTILGYYVKA